MRSVQQNQPRRGYHIELVATLLKDTCASLSQALEAAGYVHEDGRLMAHK
jgi:hypothetical protein